MRDRNREKALKLTGRALKEYQMINQDDRVMVAVSGGLDSLVMLDILAHKKRIVPVNFTLVPVHIKPMGLGYNQDLNLMEDVCSRHGLDMTYREINLEQDAKDTTGSICHVCALKRRGMLFKTAQELECGKLAMGHHRDDALETLFLNMVYNGAISSMPGKLEMFDGNLHMIRPMILMQRADVIGYARSAGIPGDIPPCPHEEKNRREDIRELIKSMESMYPRAKNSLYKALSNIHHEYMP